MGSDYRKRVNRNGLSGRTIEPMTDAEKAKLEEEVGRLFENNLPKTYKADFSNRVEDRVPLILDAYSHHRCESNRHMANLVMLAGRQLQREPKRKFPAER